MYTQYDKAIAGLLTSLIGVLAAFNMPVGWITPEIIAAVTPFVTMIVVFLVPNLPSPTQLPPRLPSMEPKK